MLSARVRHARPSADGDLIVLTHDLLEEYSKGNPPSVPVRLQRLKSLISSRATGLTDAIRIHLWNDCPIVHARDEGEMFALILHLSKLGLIHYSQRNEPALDVTVTVDGWTDLQSPGSTSTVFVAMAFNDEMTPAYEAIRAAIYDDCKLDPHRVDKRQYEHQITEEIITGLQQCWLVVADVTHGKNGVYFEAGYGMALGRPVIFSVREDRLLTDVHFDTRQYPHVVWKNEADLREQLAGRIKAAMMRAGRLI
jgi:hypothetical protein